jgi:hypothetical protein
MNTQLYNILIHGGISADAAWELCKIEERLSTTELVADTATAGDPGTYTTADTYTVSAPKDLLVLSGVTADPVTHWVAGDYVQCVDGDKGYWDGAAWVEGISPGFAATGADAGSPGAFTPTGANVPADLATLIALEVVADPLTVWAENEHVVLGDDSHAYWDSTEWLEGEGPA